MTGSTRNADIPGTTLFDGDMAQKGYALNRMCYSFNLAANRGRSAGAGGVGCAIRFHPPRRQR